MRLRVVQYIDGQWVDIAMMIGQSEEWLDNYIKMAKDAFFDRPDAGFYIYMGNKHTLFTIDKPTKFIKEEDDGE